MTIRHAPSVPDARSQTQARSALRDVVERLCAAQHDGGTSGPSDRQSLLSRDAVINVVEALRSAMFPGYFGDHEIDEDSLRFHVGATLARVLLELQEQIRRGLCFVARNLIPGGARSAKLTPRRSRTHSSSDCPRCGACSAPTCWRPTTATLPPPRRPKRSSAIRAFWRSPTTGSPTNCTQLNVPLVPTDDHRVRAQHHRHRHSPGDEDRRAFLHRSRHRRGDWRDGRDREPRAHLPGRDARGEELPARRARTPDQRNPAASDHRGRRDDLQRGDDSRTRHDRRRLGHRRQRVADSRRASQQPDQSGARLARSSSPTARGI